MLKLKNLFENFDLAKEVLDRYGYDKKTVDRYFPYFRVSSNAIYPFLTEDRKKVCFLRLSPIEEKAPSAVESEVRLISWLVEKGFPAMKPYPMKDGTMVGQVDTEWGRYNVSCFERVPGETLDDLDGNNEIAFGYGKLLARFHNTVEAYPRGETRPDHVALLSEVRQRFADYGAPSLLQAELDLVTDELEKLPKTEKTYGMVHYDFEPDNVLYDDETGEFGVIDFDDSIRCFFALDMVRALDAMDDVTEDNTDEAREAFLKGYRTEREFTEEQETSLPLMRRLVALQSYGTILYVLSDEVDDKPDWMEEIIGKLTATKNEIEANIRGNGK